MKKTSLFAVVGVILIILIFLGFSFFTVPEGKVGLSSPNDAQILKPGLHFKWPWKTVNDVAVNLQSSSFALPLPGNAETLQLTLLWKVQEVTLFQPQILGTLEAETAKMLTPALRATPKGPLNLSALLVQKLQGDPVLTGSGIAVVQVWVKSIVPDPASQTKIYANMQGLATQIGAGIVQNAAQQAEQIRNTAEQNFLQAQNTALQSAAKILGQGNTAAVQTIAALYHQSPALFQAYVAAKMNLLAKETNS